MKLSTLLVLPFASAVLAAPQKPCRGTEKALLSEHAGHPIEFCRVYNALPRKSTPFPVFRPKRLRRICQCILKKAGPPAKNVRSAGTHKNAKRCNPNDVKILKKEYKNAVGFSRWYLSAERTRSTFYTGISAKNLQEAAACVVSPPKPSTTKKSSSKPATVASTSSSVPAVQTTTTAAPVALTTTTPLTTTQTTTTTPVAVVPLPTTTPVVTSVETTATSAETLTTEAPTTAPTSAPATTELPTSGFTTPSPVTPTSAFTSPMTVTTAAATTAAPAAEAFCTSAVQGSQVKADNADGGLPYNFQGRTNGVTLVGNAAATTAPITATDDCTAIQQCANAASAPLTAGGPPPGFSTFNIFFSTADQAYVCNLYDTTQSFDTTTDASIGNTYLYNVATS